MAQATILVVEDDSAIRRGLADALRFAGYDVLEAADGRCGLDLAIESGADLVLLDVTMPGLDGFAVLEELRRARPALPVVMVTARGSEDDRVRGLRRGADDYIVKPFSPRELLARVEAVLRRSPQHAPDVRALRQNGLTIDLERLEVLGAAGAPTARLTDREAAILRYLAACRDRAVDRSELLHRIWGLDPRGIRTRTVDMHIARLREKIEADPASPTLILTVRGRGYMLAGSVEAVSGP